MPENLYSLFCCQAQRIQVKASILLVIFGNQHQINKHNHNERQLGSLFGKPDWKSKVLLNF